MNADPAPRLPGNLPGALSSFIGRRREMTAVAGLLAEHRLLTLTGPGGSGKTRLSLEVGRAAQPDYADGVWLAELAALGAGELVPQTVAAALGVRERSDESLLDSLVGHLRPRHTLILLDNCEHLLDACAELGAALLAACPDLRLLATSREPLGIPGEGVWLVPPLSLPAPQPWRNPASGPLALDGYRQAEAVQLFEARARAALPSFELTADNAPWVADICRRLDGLPLALELAAARVRAFSARQIAERLDDRFRLLTSRRRAGPPRHQTLAAALDWSHDLLAGQERALLRRLAVFAGSWRLGAAEAVAAGDDVAAPAVLELLSSLVDKSWVVVERAADERRYSFLETVRQYAHEKLAAAGEEEATREKHLAYYTQWAESAAPFLLDRDPRPWLGQFDAELDNLRAAFEWAAAGQARAGVRLAAASGRYWRLRGYLSEGRERLSRALASPQAQDRSPERAAALVWGANLAYLQSDYAATRTLAEEALAIGRALGPAGRPAVASALDYLGELSTEIGDYAGARTLFADALALFEELEDRRGAADMLMQLGWAAMRAGEYGEAEIYLKKSLVIIREVGEPNILGLLLSGLGELAVRQGQYDEAEALLSESLALRRSLGDRWGIAAALGSLGWVALRRRDFEWVAAALGESVHIRMEIGDHGGAAWCLEKLAEAAAVQAHTLPPTRRQRASVPAVRVFGAAAAIRAARRWVIDAADQPAYRQRLDDLRRIVGPEPFEAAWEEGGRLSLQEAAELALAAARPATVGGLRATTGQPEFGGLTARERQTARLIARGYSNSEIAAAMTVGVKTVETYVTRILNKLGFESRVQIALWAVERGLVAGEE